MVRDFDWALWAKNFPVKVEREAAVAGMPAGISITRAGQSVFLSMEELSAIVWTEEKVPPKLDPFPLNTYTGKFDPRPEYSQNPEDYK